MIIKTLIETPSVIDIDIGRKIGNCILVHNKQPISIHKAVEQIAYYFKREGEFDFVQYTAYEDKDNPKSDSYIWIDSNFEDTFAVGATNFRFRGDVGQQQRWSMEWVWFHPYYRNKGLLTGAWKAFQKKYGKDFLLEPPLSKAMEAFINKMKGKENE